MYYPNGAQWKQRKNWTDQQLDVSSKPIKVWLYSTYQNWLIHPDCWGICNAEMRVCPTQFDTVTFIFQLMKYAILSLSLSQTHTHTHTNTHTHTVHMCLCVSVWLILLHSERSKLYAILAFLSAIGLNLPVFNTDIRATWSHGKPYYFQHTHQSDMIPWQILLFSTQISERHDPMANLTIFSTDIRATWSHSKP